MSGKKIFPVEVSGGPFPLSLGPSLGLRVKGIVCVIVTVDLYFGRRGGRRPTTGEEPSGLYHVTVRRSRPKRKSGFPNFIPEGEVKIGETLTNRLGPEMRVEDLRRDPSGRSVLSRLRTTDGDRSGGGGTHSSGLNRDNRVSDPSGERRSPLSSSHVRITSRLGYRSLSFPASFGRNEIIPTTRLSFRPLGPSVIYSGETGGLDPLLSLNVSSLSICSFIVEMKTISISYSIQKLHGVLPTELYGRFTLSRED